MKQHDVHDLKRGVDQVGEKGQDFSFMVQSDTH